MHGNEHASNKLVDTIAFLHQWDQSGNTTLIIGTWTKVTEDELLEGVDLVLQDHQVHDGFESLIGIIGTLEGDVILVLEETIEFGMKGMILEFGEDKVDVGTDEDTITTDPIITTEGTGEILDELNFSWCLLENDRMPLTNDLVDGDEGLEALNLISVKGSGL